MEAGGRIELPNRGFAVFKAAIPHDSTKFYKAIITKPLSLNDTSKSSTFICQILIISVHDYTGITQRHLFEYLK